MQTVLNLKGVLDGFSAMLASANPCVPVPLCEIRFVFCELSVLRLDLVVLHQVTGSFDQGWGVVFLFQDSDGGSRAGRARAKVEFKGDACVREGFLEVVILGGL